LHLWSSKVSSLQTSFTHLHLKKKMTPILYVSVTHYAVCIQFYSPSFQISIHC
jgi:hypothetical protein